MKYFVTRLDICVPVNNKQWASMRKLDASIDNNWKDLITETLKPLGAMEIEFNGHFGQNFFFSCENELEAKIITNAFEKLLSKF